MPPKKSTEIHPQTAVTRFWSRYYSKTPGKITSILPRKLYKDLAPYPDSPRSSVRNAGQSYEAARAECLEMVRHAVEQCDRQNVRFSDPEFDVEIDFYRKEYNCIYGLERHGYEAPNYDSDGSDNVRPYTTLKSVKNSLRTIVDSGMLASNYQLLDLNALERLVGQDDYEPSKSETKPGSVHRLDWIFENPQFTVNGFSSTDIKQGSVGDCWWLAAVANIAHRKDLMDKICVARDEECGVYGFVFYRDGEWVPTVVDDNLYLRYPDFASTTEVYDATGKKGRRYKKEKQTGSEALLYGQCIDENETWLPLLEKAYAKVHGDYEAINGGWAGSGVEDLTGGVNTVIQGSSVLRKDRLWRELASAHNEDCEFVFGLSAMSEATAPRKNGIVFSHAYSILRATEVEDDDGKKLRLVKIRNPWGCRSSKGYGEWQGPWSDGSKEWTPTMQKKLNRSFADDGVFWMLFEDMLANFKWIHRTRLFDNQWTVAQQWFSSPISWVPGYLKTSFTIEVNVEGLVVIVLSQLDGRYFKGLDGNYKYSLDFLLRKKDSTAPLLEAKGFHSTDRRSVNCEVHLKPGTYEVLPRVTAEKRDWKKPVEAILKNYAQNNPKKLQQVGLQYDRAHAKAGVLDEEVAQEEKRRKERAKRKKDKAKQSKIKEMSDAMEKLQAAFTGAKEELGQRIGSLEKGNRQKSNKSDESTSSSMENADSDTTPRLPPGFWPEDLFKAEAAEQGPTTDATTEPQRTFKQAESTYQPPASSSEPGSAGEASKDVAPAPPPQDVDPSPSPDNQVSSDPDSGSSRKAVAEKSDSEDSDKSDSDNSDSESDSDDDDEEDPKKPAAWNPVCVMGLRVYAQDKELKVRLTEKTKSNKAASTPILTPTSDVSTLETPQPA